MQELNEDTTATLLTSFLHRAAFPFFETSNKYSITIKKSGCAAYLISNGSIKQFSAVLGFRELPYFLREHFYCGMMIVNVSEEMILENAVANAERKKK